MIMTLIRKRKELAAMRAEAKRRGITFTELMEVLTPLELAEIIERDVRKVDMSRWELPQRSELDTTPRTGSTAIDTAVAAARTGDWEPAAGLLTECHGDWDFRAAVVDELGEAAADDDAWLTAWRTDRPNDRHADVVGANALMSLAWQMRGVNRAKDTSDAQFAGFHRLLGDARQAAEQAAAALPDDPTPWYTLLGVARGLGFGHDEFGLLWQGLVARHPLHRRGHNFALQYWCKKWHGSHERMFAFAEEAAALAPSLNTLVLRASFEKQMDGDEQAWSRPAVRTAVDTLSPWLDGDGADNVDVLTDLGWTAMALVKCDRAAEALPLFRRLGTYAGGSPWSYLAEPAASFHRYRVQACQAGS